MLVQLRNDTGPDVIFYGDCLARSSDEHWSRDDTRQHLALYAITDGDYVGSYVCDRVTEHMSRMYASHHEVTIVHASDQIVGFFGFSVAAKVIYDESEVVF